MAGKIQIPKQFTFGPYCLKTYPPKQAFKTQFPLLFEQQCLIDNLFNQPKTAQYTDILHAMVGHLANLNSQIENLQNQCSANTAEPVFSPLWHEKERRLVAENKARSIRVFKLEKDLEVFGKKLAEKTIELNLLKKDWEKEWQNKQDYLEVFPEKLDEVRKKIRDIVMSENKRRLLTTQECLRTMAKTKKVPFKGLALYVLALKEAKHLQQYCKCYKGFNFVQASIDLRTWQDVDCFYLSETCLNQKC